MAQAKNRIICIAPDGVDDLRLARQEHSYHYGEVFTPNRWYKEQLLEFHSDKFAVWTQELDDQINKPEPTKEPAKRKTAAKAS